MNDWTSPLSQALRRPIVKGLLCGAVSIICTAFLVTIVPPAWAVSIPIGNLFVLDLGDLPPWIGVIVAFFVWWDARQAKKKAAEAAAVASAGVAKIEAVAVQIDGLLVKRDKDNVSEGEEKGRLAGEAKAETLAQGQREGRDTERESVAAKGAVHGTHAAEGDPLPVKDDLAATIGKRVAEATEKSADAQQQIADTAKKK